MVRAVTPNELSGALPELMASAFLIGYIKKARLDAVSGFSRRWYEKTKSSAVTGSPSLHRALGRSSNVQVKPSGETFHEIAAPGTMWPAEFMVVSPRYRSLRMVSSSRKLYRCGSRVAGSPVFPIRMKSARPFTQHHKADKSKKTRIGDTIRNGRVASKTAQCVYAELN